MEDIDSKAVRDIATTLSRQVSAKIIKEKYAGSLEVLKLVAAGAFLASAVVAPNLLTLLKPFLTDKNEFVAWKRFNIPYLKRTLRRLEKRQLINTYEKNGFQVIELAERGQTKILKMALDDLEVKAPREWDGRWRLVSYDIPVSQKKLRRVLKEYLTAWGFYPFQESVYLHAYPCEKQVAFLRSYLNAGEFIRILKVSQIENDGPFRDYFGV